MFTIQAAKAGANGYIDRLMEDFVVTDRGDSVYYNCLKKNVYNNSPKNIICINCLMKIHNNFG